MTIFYQGTLQDGIALAVREAKAVVCFVRDDAQLSSTWEDEYFADDEVAQVLGERSVLLRLAAGTQEAGFLTSFCPIAELPTVVVIKNGTLHEYLGPELSKDQFRSRLIPSVDDKKASYSTQQPQSGTAAASNDTTVASSSVAGTPIAPHASLQQQSPQTPTDYSRPVGKESKGSTSMEKSPTNKAPVKKSTPLKSELPKEDPKEKPKDKQQKGKAPQVFQKPAESKTSTAAAHTAEDSKPQRPAPRAPPTQFRLQVRLFDGRSIRSSFSPTQTIHSDVRPWLDEQMIDDHRPYNLKHILTPLPSRTLSVTEESQSLQDLGLGSTATLVMVPVQSYTEAYAAAGSLPVRGISAVYNVVSSVAGTTTGLVGSLLGYGPSASANDAQSFASASAENTRRPRPTGPNIRTLRDQQNSRGDNQFYNGNQLNFEPRNKDSKDN